MKVWPYSKTTCMCSRKTRRMSLGTILFMGIFIMVDIIYYDWCIIKIVLLFDPCKRNIALITTYHIDNCEECCVLSTTQIIMEVLFSQFVTFLWGFHFSGFLIPKGWRIYVFTRELNYDPVPYPEPSTFNPWRWLVSYLSQTFY